MTYQKYFIKEEDPQTKVHKLGGRNHKKKETQRK
jgi:hypothetical protein